MVRAGSGWFTVFRAGSAAYGGLLPWRRMAFRMYPTAMMLMVTVRWQAERRAEAARATTGMQRPRDLTNSERAGVAPAGTGTGCRSFGQDMFRPCFSPAGASATSTGTSSGTRNPPNPNLTQTFRRGNQHAMIPAAHTRVFARIRRLPV